MPCGWAGVPQPQHRREPSAPGLVGAATDPGRPACSAPLVEDRGAWACSGALQLFKVTDPFHPTTPPVREQGECWVEVCAAHCPSDMHSVFCSREGHSPVDLFLPSAHVGPQLREHFRLEIFEGCTFSGQRLELQEDCPPAEPEESGLSRDLCQCHRSVGGWSVSADGTVPNRWALPGRCGGLGVVRPWQAGSLSPAPEALPRSAASPASGTHRPGRCLGPEAAVPQASPRAQRQEAHGRSL